MFAITFAMALPAHTHRSRSRLPLVLATAVITVVAVTTAAVLWPGGPYDQAKATASEPTPTPVTAASAIPGGTPEPSASSRPEPSPQPPPPVKFTLVTGGDILTHGPVLTSARHAGGGPYDFGALMQGVRPFVESADLAICHLEVPVAPPGTQPSGYPTFGAPAELIPAIAAEGWDGCSTASNHSVDRRYAGLEATLAALDAEGLGHAGMARTADEAASTQMYSVRQGERRITVANISFTYGLNGLPQPEGKPWAVATFDAEAQNVQPILDSAQQARNQGADIVVASVHCCVEYQVQPNDAQRSIVEQIAESGLVDLYVGHHAHVPQPIELVEGGVRGTGMWAYFGHGNYLSNQDTQCCKADTNSGYLGITTFTVSPDGDVDVEAQWAATTVDRLGRHTMYMLRDIMDTGAGRISASEAQARHERVARAAGDQAAELTSVPLAYADAAYRIYRGGSEGRFSRP